MAYAMQLASSTLPIPPTATLFPAAKEKPQLNLNCPGGVCATNYHDKVFTYTPSKGKNSWSFLLTYAPIAVLVILILILIAWIPRHYQKCYEEYEESLHQRLVDAMKKDEKEIDV